MISTGTEITAVFALIANQNFILIVQSMSFHSMYYRLPRRSGFFCPGNRRFSKRLIKLFLLRDFEMRLDLGLPWIFGV